MKIIAWCIDPNDIKNKNTVEYPHPSGIQKSEILITDTQNGIQNDDTSSTPIKTTHS